MATTKSFSVSLPISLNRACIKFEIRKSIFLCCRGSETWIFFLSKLRCGFVSVPMLEIKEEKRKKKEGREKKVRPKPRTLYKWVHVQRRSFLAQDKESTSKREKRLRTLSKKYVILALNDRRRLRSVRGVSAGAEGHEIRFTWTGISQIGFVRSRITFVSSTASRTNAFFDE